MNTSLIKRLSIIVLGGIAGGAVGYLLAKFVIDQLLEQQKEFEWEEKNKIKVGKPGSVKQVNKIDYTKFGEKGTLSELVKPYTEPEVKSEHNNIRVISLEEYQSNRTNIEEISYYAGDTTFCNMNEEIIPNPEDFFGPNVHLRFGEESEDPDIVYVRNENNGVSYEITQLPGKYSVIVLGLPDEEKKVTKARRRKTTKAKSLEDEESIENEGED